MRPRQQFGSLIASMLVVGCPGMVSGPEAGGTTGGSSGASTGMALGFGGTAVNGGTAGFGGTASSSTSAPNVDTGCVTAEYTFQQLPQVNILFLLDKTGGIGYQNSDTAGALDNCADQWNPVVSALNVVFAQPISSRIYSSLAFLTAERDNTSACDPSNYGDSPGLKVPLTQLDDAGRKQFQDRLCDCASGAAPSNSTCIFPSGGTPTRPAIQGTIDYASNVAQNYPGRRTRIVFITDGEPGFACQNSAGAKQICNSCDDLKNGCLDDASKCLDYDTEVQRISTVIQSAPARSISVVAMGTNLSETTLNAWATASGNDLVDLRALDGPAASLMLMNAMVLDHGGSSIKCDFDVPASPNGEAIDPKMTFVYYAPSSGSGYYLRQTPDGTSATCSTTVGYWYFDDPMLPKKVVLCGATCSALQQETSAVLQIAYGCRHGTIVS
jgi:hypothetical protein